MIFNKKNIIMLLPIFLLAILAKIYEYKYMDQNAFILINYILTGIYQGALTGYNSVDFPIKVLSIFKFLNLTNPISSGIFCAIVMNTICFFILSCKGKKYKSSEYIFIYITMFILNFTTFDFNKDIIQFWIVLFIYVIITSKIKSNIKKIILVLGVILLESILFRSYYLLIFGLFPIICSLLSELSKKDIAINKKKRKIIINVVLIFLIFYLITYLMQFLSYSSYLELINRRNNLENIDANTMIRNLVSGNGFMSFCINYFINLIRCMIPIELFLKGIKYAAFALYQFYITINIIKALFNLNKNNILSCSFILAYCMTLAASESDFGTFVRHQSVLMIFYLYLIVDNHRKKKIGEEINYERKN